LKVLSQETLEEMKTMEYKIIPEISNKHYFYKNGEVFNGIRYLTFSKNSENYLVICGIIPGKSYKVHRLMCLAFHPIPGKTSLSDYDDLQVNHIDGNTFNNHADNLEWLCQSDNMSHAYSTKLNKKSRVILQYDRVTGNFMNEYPSIAEAARITGQKQQVIRRSSKRNKITDTNPFIWKYKYPEESTEYTRKYSVYK